MKQLHGRSVEPPNTRRLFFRLIGCAAPLVTLSCDAAADPTYQGEPLVTIRGRVEVARDSSDIAVGVLWLKPATQRLDDAVECSVVFAEGGPSDCVAACGPPSCDDLLAHKAWSACSEACEEPTGIQSVIVNAYFRNLVSGAVGQTIPVEGTFPAQFQLELFEPPPDGVVSTSSTGEQVAFGLFVALNPAGAPFELSISDLPKFPAWLLGASGTHVLVFTRHGLPRNSQWGELLGLELPPGLHLAENRKQEVEGEVEEQLIPVSGSSASEVGLVVADPSTIDWPLTQL